MKATIFGVLDKAIEEPIDRDRIDAMLHQFELGFKHKQSNFGLNLMFSMATTWAHGGKVMDSLEIEERLDELRNASDEVGATCGASDSPLLVLTLW